MTSYPSEEFTTGNIRPVECVKAGWALIKDQYWLFMGIVFVGVFIGSAVPIVLIGPMMVGIYLCFFRRMRGETVEFGNLFKGFDHFAQALIAALLQMIPMVIVLLPAYVIFFVLFFTSMPRGRYVSDAEMTSFVFTLLGLELVFVVVVVIVAIAIGAFFMFTFPLIADRNLSGVDAVKLSIKAGKANFSGILLLLLLNAALGIVGALACYVGIFFVMPISIASYAVAYRKVFAETAPIVPSPPPPPPAGWAA